MSITWRWEGIAMEMDALKSWNAAWQNASDPLHIWLCRLWLSRVGGNPQVHTCVERLPSSGLAFKTGLKFFSRCTRWCQLTTWISHVICRRWIQYTARQILWYENCWKKFSYPFFLQLNCWIFHLAINPPMMYESVKIRGQRAGLCGAPWKGAKHQIFLRQVSPLSPFGPLAGLSEKLSG